MRGRQVICMIDKEGVIQRIIGDKNDIFTNSSILYVGASIHTISWKSIFLQDLDFYSSFQSLTTKNDKTIFFHRYSGSDISVTFEGSIWIFTNNTIYDNAYMDTTLVYNSTAMKNIMSIIENVSKVDSIVLLLGESGVGKTALAQLIHKKSKRRKGPFLSVNCGSLPDSLIESELFGYEAGTFTGGHKKGKKGLFKAAENGTILLDEIAELPFFMQSKLLDVVQNNKIRKVGGIQEQTINVRILAATNQNLSNLVEKKKFREDLYYRLNVVPIKVPPLRKRKEEIPYLVKKFLSNFNKKYNRSVTLNDELMDEFLSYHWPGNIRELSNRIERLVVTNNVSDYKMSYHSNSNHDSFDSVENPFKKHHPTSFPSLKEAKLQVEKNLILKAYNIFENTYKTAEVLNVDQSTISKKMKQYRNEGAI